MVRRAPDPSPGSPRPLEALVTAPTPPPPATGEDAARADGVIRAWTETGDVVSHARRNGRTAQRAALLELRGLLVAAFADCRNDAYADAFADAKAGRL